MRIGLFMHACLSQMLFHAWFWPLAESFVHQTYSIIYVLVCIIVMFVTSPYHDAQNKPA